MSATPREIGTLIVVILKARHLPNKRHIGKQDPYCLASLNGEKRRTKAIKRGGQHPEWDEEVRFTLYEDTDDVLARTANDDDAPPPPPPKDKQSFKNIKGGKIMHLSCWDDDPREPHIIGETAVDLTEVLTKGETDEWFTLLHKEKFAGEVYLELTFWSNEPPPEEKKKRKPAPADGQYGGPGTFVPTGGLPTGHTPQNSRVVSTSVLSDRPPSDPESFSTSLRASSSLAQLDLYVPPYEQRHQAAPLDAITNDFAELGVSDHHRRRESFPPPNRGHTPRPSTSTGFSSLSVQSNFHYGQMNNNNLLYNRPSSSYANPLDYDGQSHYTTHYDPAPYAGMAYNPSSSIRGPRYSIPVSSSGFMPLSAQNPAAIYDTPPYNPSNFSSYSAPNPPQPVPTPFQALPSQPYQQTPYAVSSPTATPNAYVPPQSGMSSIPSAPSQQYNPYMGHSPNNGPPQPSLTPLPQSGDHSYQAYASQHDAASSQLTTSTSTGPSSRPLPQQPQPPYQVPPPSNFQQLPVSYNAEQKGPQQLPLSSSYAGVTTPLQPPPPPASLSQPYLPHEQTSSTPFPPPPPPPPSIVQNAARRRASLPQPPMNPQTMYQNIPPPPPLPVPPPPPLQGDNYFQPSYAGPLSPPRPPVPSSS